jgi:hypothetical protein
MKGDKPLSDFIKTNGIYQSTAKVSGEIHAACFMFETSWTYIRFKKDFILLGVLQQISPTL